MSNAACQVGLSEVDSFLQKVGEEKAGGLPEPCAQLVDKLCADLDAGSAECSRARERAGSLFELECRSMLGAYAKTLSDLKRERDKGMTGDQADRTGQATPIGADWKGVKQPGCHTNCTNFGKVCLSGCAAWHEGVACRNKCIEDWQRCVDDCPEYNPWWDVG